jgi:hypothetical protein
LIQLKLQITPTLIPTIFKRSSVLQIDPDFLVLKESPSSWFVASERISFEVSYDNFSCSPLFAATSDVHLLLYLPPHGITSSSLNVNPFGRKKKLSFRLD